ncbi:MAG: hypothetical protein KW804_02950 [Candidatus Doudnabacteria bacterium]|nr:hypothetical protein [Candidatus Doudnabacteria bacterium]
MFEFSSTVPKVGTVVRFIVLETRCYRRGEEVVLKYKEEGHYLFECIVVSRKKDEEGIRLVLLDKIHDFLIFKEGEVLGETQTSEGYKSIVRLV